MYKDLSMQRSYIILAGFVVTVLMGYTANGQIHFHYTSNTGNNATVAVPTTANPGIGGTPLASGDEIGVFTPDGLCVGAVVWSGANAVITVWGDNDQTPEIDGMRGGEQIFYRVWQQSTNTEYISVNVTYLQGDGMYSGNAIYILSSLSAVVPPTVPQLLSPSDGATDISVTPTLTWNASSRATSYELQASTSSAFTTTAADDSTIVGTSRQVGPLGNSIRYYWRVRAKNSGGTSSWSTVRNFTTVPAVPLAPSLISPANGVTDRPTTLTLIWNASTGASSYHLQLSTSAAFTIVSVDDSTLTSTSRQVGPLANNTTYYWRVNAKNSGGTSNWSTIWSFTTVPLPPPAPTLASPVSGSTKQPTTLTASWIVSTGASSYHLQLSTSAAFTTVSVDDSTLTSVSRQVGSLANNTTYYWRVNAKNSGGTSGWSSIWSFTTVPLAPATPALVSPINGAANQPTTLTVSWNASSGASSYRFQLSTTAAFTTVNVDDSALVSTSRQVGSLANNTTYYWRVNAKNSGGTSNWSTAWSFTTVPLPPAVPTLVSPINGITGQSVPMCRGGLNHKKVYRQRRRNSKKAGDDTMTHRSKRS